ncbi:trypsin-like serine protease [Amycolatopsis circi]|uniref:trypsin-like serine protease n=1 Tax=Amycolatopsis circi TaxID=871959 RepID=UPI0013BEA700|nr:trypsin-like serine protease [Amycolatopsis circi]
MVHAGGLRCGRASIAPEAVLTAGTALPEKRAEDIHVVGGRQLWSGADGRRSEVRRIGAHPEYASEKHVNDIAVLNLSR